MPYLRGSLAKECLVTLSSSEKCLGIRCYASKVDKQYLNEGAKTFDIAIGTVIESATVSTFVNVGTAVVGSAIHCVLKPPKTYVGGALCIAGTLLSNCAVIP